MSKAIEILPSEIKHIGNFCKMTVRINGSISTYYPANNINWQNNILLAQFVSYSRILPEKHFTDIILWNANRTFNLKQQISAWPENLHSFPSSCIQELDGDIDVFVTLPQKRATRYLAIEEHFNDINGKIKYTKRKSTPDELLDVRALERFIGNKIIRVGIYDKMILERICLNIKNQKKKNIKVCESSVVFMEKRSTETHFNECEVKISVKDLIIKVEISLTSDLVLKELHSSKKSRQDAAFIPEQNLIQLKAFLSKLNLITNSGQFYINQSAIRFISTFYAPFPESAFNTCISLVKKCIDSYYMHTDLIYQICTTRESITLKEALHIAENPYLPQDKYKIIKLLIHEKFDEERKLVEFMLKKSKGEFINNRFLLRSISLSNSAQTGDYPRLTTGDSFDIAVDESPADTMDTCFDLVNELSLIGLYFKNSRFPLEDFSWDGDNPIYVYTRPLCEVLEALPGPPLDYTDKILANINLALLEKKRERTLTESRPMEQSEMDKFLVSPRLIQLKESTARERLQLYKDNPYDFVERYQGLTENQNCWAIIASARPRTRFVDMVSTLTPNKLYAYFKELLEYIAVINSKNSSVAALGPDSLWVNGKGKLKITLMTNDEVKDEFKAPEVRAGKVCRNSLVYSFGKLLASVVFENNFQRYTEAGLEIPERFQISHPDLCFAIFQSISYRPISRASVAVLQNSFAAFNEIRPFRN